MLIQIVKRAALYKTQSLAISCISSIIEEMNDQVNSRIVRSLSLSHL